MRAGLLWPALVALAACGYTAGLDLAGHGIRTVAVDVAGNESFRHRYEIPLTREINEALMQFAGVSTASHATADAILTVDMENVAERTLVTGATPVEEGELVFSVRAVLRNRETGAVLRDRRFVERSEFHIPVGETEQFAVEVAADNLAKRIALALEPDF